jgi:hypothetical protein
MTESSLTLQQLEARRVGGEGREIDETEGITFRDIRLGGEGGRKIAIT